jgi:hypothetical protein
MFDCCLQENSLLIKLRYTSLDRAFFWGNHRQAHSCGSDNICACVA